MKSWMLTGLLLVAVLALSGALVWMMLQIDERNKAVAAASIQAAELEVALQQAVKERDVAQAELDTTLTRFQKEIADLNSRLTDYQSRLLRMTREQAELAPKSARDNLPIKMRQLVTVEGVVYNNVTILAIGEDSIEIRHDAGGGTLPARRLPEDVRNALDLE